MAVEVAHVHAMSYRRPSVRPALFPLPDGRAGNHGSRPHAGTRPVPRSARGRPGDIVDRRDPGIARRIPAIRSQRGGPWTIEGATRSVGWSSQSISALNTARVPVNRMNARNSDSFRPTHWWTTHHRRRPLAFLALVGAAAAVTQRQRPLKLITHFDKGRARLAREMPAAIVETRCSIGFVENIVDAQPHVPRPARPVHRPVEYEIRIYRLVRQAEALRHIITAQREGEPGARDLVARPEAELVLRRVGKSGRRRRRW